MKVTKVGRLENVGPMVVASAKGNGASVEWTCGCNARTLREDFAHGRLVCQRCGATVSLDDAIEMVQGVIQELAEMMLLFREELAASLQVVGDEAE